MKRVKTADLTGPALDWAVAKCRGFAGLDEDLWLMRDGIADMPLHAYTPSTDWAQGGPIIERMVERHGLVFACRGKTVVCSLPFSIEHQEWFGDTPLIAAMRCFATKALGAEVDVPEELL